MNKEKVTKKDLIYFIIILVLILIAILSSDLFDNPEAVSYIGFAGTITSILLAFIAIIYSFFQSSTYENTAHKLESSANKIENISKDLEDVTEIKKVTSELISTINFVDTNIQSLNEVVASIDDKVMNVQESNYQIFDSLLSDKFIENNSQYEEEILSQAYNKQYFSFLLSKLSKQPISVIIGIHQLTTNSLRISKNEFIQTILNSIYPNNEFKSLSKVASNMNVATLLIFHELDFYNLVIEDEMIFVSEMNSELFSAIEEFLAEYKHHDYVYKDMIDFILDSFEKNGIK